MTINFSAQIEQKNDAYEVLQDTVLEETKIITKSLSDKLLNMIIDHGNKFNELGVAIPKGGSLQSITMKLSFADANDSLFWSTIPKDSKLHNFKNTLPKTESIGQEIFSNKHDGDVEAKIHEVQPVSNHKELDTYLIPLSVATEKVFSHTLKALQESDGNSIFNYSVHWLKDTYSFKSGIRPGSALSTTATNVIQVTYWISEPPKKEEESLNSKFIKTSFSKIWGSN
ncbi:MAG: hypothetical protein VX777_00455 [Chlamydiota bacterium]|nr:hypothetical protein [Chlamydiota bacterium]